MAVFVLDTDILSLHQRDHSQVHAAVSARATDTLCVSTVTVEEQIGGWSALARSAKTPQEHEHAAMFLSALVASWSRFALVPLTVTAITRFETLVKVHRNVKRNDLRIAAIALELGASVVTRNRRDFGRVPGLAIEDWSL
ncbi:MAG TPA: type II toxin-antitoxin system VapC family toxin [Gemmataceae bacterium]|nr:type II toxin-antitoxin system VapC family toxin [Gemmataceae bacterium]